MRITIYKHPSAYNFSVFKTTWRLGAHKFKVVSTCLTTSFSAFLSSQVSWAFQPHLLYFCKEHHLPSLPAQGKASQPAAYSRVDSTENSLSRPTLKKIRNNTESSIVETCCCLPQARPISVFPFSIRTWKERCMIRNSGKGPYLLILQRSMPGIREVICKCFFFFFFLVNAFDDIDPFSKLLWSWKCSVLVICEKDGGNITEKSNGDHLHLMNISQALYLLHCGLYVSLI